MPLIKLKDHASAYYGGAPMSGLYIGGEKLWSRTETGFHPSQVPGHMWSSDETITTYQTGPVYPAIPLPRPAGQDIYVIMNFESLSDGMILSMQNPGDNPWTSSRLEVYRAWGSQGHLETIGSMQGELRRLGLTPPPDRMLWEFWITPQEVDWLLTPMNDGSWHNDRADAVGMAPPDATSHLTLGHVLYEGQPDEGFRWEGMFYRIAVFSEVPSIEHRQALNEWALEVGL